MNVYSKFETELAVRPDDIDLYQHVHSTRYLDYVLAARFEQMGKNYGLSMQAFADRGLGWFMASATIHY
jgi:acyl-CoA thioester hydrolase/thioesterase-3